MICFDDEEYNEECDETVDRVLDDTDERST